MLLGCRCVCLGSGLFKSCEPFPKRLWFRTVVGFDPSIHHLTLWLLGKFPPWLFGQSALVVNSYAASHLSEGLIQSIWPPLWGWEPQDWMLFRSLPTQTSHLRSGNTGPRDLRSGLSGFNALKMRYSAQLLSFVQFANLSLSTTNCLWSQIRKMVTIWSGPRPSSKRASGWIPSFLLSLWTSPSFWTHCQ